MTINGNPGDGFININSSYRFRIHHLKIDRVPTRAIVVTGSSGVIDHCEFLTTNGYNAIRVLGSEESRPSGRWNQPMTFGSIDQVYIEDNTFTATLCVTSLGVFDGYMGSRLVFRHNTVTNWSAYLHGYDSSIESALQFEIYNNYFDMAKSDCAIPRMLFIRGGTGYLYNNTMHLTDPYNRYEPRFATLRYYRSTESQQGSLCNGSSPLDENRPGMNGYLCYQQPGSGGPGPHTSIPVYEYNNVGTGNMPANLTVTVDSSPHVVANRDFFNDTPKPGYTALVYPHPLVTGSRVPAAPTNVRIIR
jgi:hypothetical protein